MKNTIIKGLCKVAAVLACASSSYAASTGATIFLWDGTAADNKTITDNAVGLDQNSADGAVTFIGAVGNWTINVDTGISKPTLGSAAHPSMDLGFVDTYNGAGGALNIAFYDNAFSSSLAGALAHIGGTLGAGMTLTYTTYTRAGNSAATFTGGALDTSVGSGWVLLTSQIFTSVSYSGDTSGGNISGGANPYSLLQVITITPSRDAAASGTSGNATLSAPDGGMTLMLLGSSLTALGFLRRSFKSVKA